MIRRLAMPARLFARRDGAGRRLVGALVLPLAMLVPSPRPAMAQLDEPVAELRRENDRLRDRVAQLEAQVAQLRDENRALATQLALTLQRLEAELAPSTTGGDPEPGMPTDNDADEGGPGAEETGTDGRRQELAALPAGTLAAPRSIFDRLVASYTEAFPTNPDSARDPRGVRERLAEVKDWSREAQEQIEGEISWLIEPLSTGRRGRFTVLRFRALDPSTGLPYGHTPDEVELTAVDARRLRAASDAERLILRGRVWARPRVAPDRERPGVFDYPPLIGPFAEFGWGIDLERVTAAPPMAGDGADPVDKSGNGSESAGPPTGSGAVSP